MDRRLSRTRRARPACSRRSSPWSRSRRAHPSRAGHLLQAVRHARERAQARAHRVRARPRAPGTPRRRPSRSRTLCAPRRRSSLDGQQRHAPPTTAARLARTARRPARRRSAPAARSRAEILDSELEWRHGDVVVALTREDAQLRPHVGRERAVAVEVVGRDVQQHRRLGRERERVLELERGRLAHDRRPSGRATRRASSRPSPTLPATATGRPASRWMCPISSTVVVLPFVPVTAMNSF